MELGLARPPPLLSTPAFEEALSVLPILQFVL